MSEKRYAIVRADMRCPYGLEETFCSNDCHRCRLGYGYYGDTKEQLVRKVAQVMQQKAGLYRNIYEIDYELAKEIVEFLGVEE